MIYFENGMTIECRTPEKPEIAKFRCSDNVLRYCIIGTQYGYLHTPAGDVRTWNTAGGARKALKRLTEV